MCGAVVPMRRPRVISPPAALWRVGYGRTSVGPRPGWVGVDRGRSGVEPSLGLRAAPAAEGCVKTLPQCWGGEGEGTTVRRCYHVV